MGWRTMFAVVCIDSHVQDAAALFDDQTHAEDHAERLSGDPDYDGEYRVAVVIVRKNSITEAT